MRSVCPEIGTTRACCKDIKMGFCFQQLFDSYSDAIWICLLARWAWNVLKVWKGECDQIDKKEWMVIRLEG